MSLLIDIDIYLFLPQFSVWLDFHEIALFDSAVCNKSFRTSKFLLDMDLTTEYKLEQQNCCFLKSADSGWLISVGEKTRNKLLRDFLESSCSQHLFKALFITGAHSVKNTTCLNLNGIDLFDLEQLKLVVDQCPFICNLSFDRPNLLTLSSCDPSLICLPHLNSLCMSKQPNDGVLAFLKAQHLGSIEKLAITDTVFFSHFDMIHGLDLQFVDILRDCLLLKDLNLSKNFAFLTDVVLLYIAKCVRTITSLNISDGGSFSDASVDTICSSLLQLTTLKLNHCETITLLSVHSICNGLPSLSCISFQQDWLQLYKAFNLILGLFDTFISVNAHMCYVEGKRGAPLQFKFNTNPRIWSQNTERKSHCKFRISFGSEALKSLIATPMTISSLQFQEDDVDSNALVALIDTHGAKLACLELKYMSISRSEVWSSVFLVPVSLSTLSIVRSPKVSSAMIISLLARNPNLTCLDFEGIDWRIAECDEVLGLGISEHCRNLQVLSLREIPINSDTVKQIGDKCGHLRHIHIASSTCVFDMSILENALQYGKHLRVCTFDNKWLNPNVESDSDDFCKEID